MTRHKRQSSRGEKSFDVDETKAHILSAGRELLLAADGALRFLRSYAKTAEPSARPYLEGFFDKAIRVADELSGSLQKIAPLKGVADEMVRSFLNKVGQEIKSEDKRRPARKGRAGRKTCRKRTSK